MNRANERETTTFDRTLTVLTIVVMLITIFTEKSRLSIAFTAILIFIVAVHPVTHLRGIGRSRVRQWLVTIALAISVALWALAQWPAMLPPTSTLSLHDVKFAPFEFNISPHIELSLMNDSPFEARVHQISLVLVTNGLPSAAAMLERETLLWKSLEDHLAQERSSTQSSDFYTVSFPPKVGTIVPVEGQPLNSVQAEALKPGGGGFVFVLSKITYEDQGAEHGLDICLFVQDNKTMPHRCEIGHNGPAEIHPKHWWNK
jgi:hypothetical protein